LQTGCDSDNTVNLSEGNDDHCLINKIVFDRNIGLNYRGADKSLARPGRKQTTATEDFEFYISYL